MKSGTARGFRLIAILALLAAAAPVQSIHAQASLAPVQNLDFGQLVPGTPTTILPTDVIRRGEINMTGNGTFTVQFALPSVLTSLTSSATIPLTFSATSAQVVVKNKTTVFNPATGTSVKLTPGSPDATVMLGGTAQPAAGQLAGTYRATVTLIYIQTG